MRRTRRGPVAGHTLAELLAVMALLTILAFLARPASNPLQPVVADTAVKEVVQALRFGQADAIRSGAYRVVSFDVTGQTVRVYALNMTPKPPVEDTANPVNHPLDKKAYTVTLNALPGSSGVALTAATFAFTGVTGTLARVTFGADGVPVNLVGPNAPDIKPLAGAGTVVISSGGVQRTVTVDADTGRVTASS